MSTRRGKKSSGGSSSAGGGGKGGGSSPAAPAEKYVRVKLTSMGDTLTGKSCLIKRFCEGKVCSLLPQLNADSFTVSLSLFLVIFQPLEWILGSNLSW